MAQRILWLDNDPAYLGTYEEALLENGFEVKLVTNVTSAERLLETETYDLLILDVMIPTKTEAEENFYPPEATDFGLKTGLLFYCRMKPKLDQNMTPVLVMTVRLDSAILDAFVKAGLKQDNFCTKMSLRERPIFIGKVKEILGKK